jgi:hypothetical protein
MAAACRAAAAVGDTSTKVLDANPRRVYAFYCNDSDTDIYLQLDGEAAAVGQGIRVPAQGGAYEMSPAYGNLVTGPLYAIHGGAGTKNLLITEGEAV